MKPNYALALVASLFISFQSQAQIAGGSISGNFQTDVQYYIEDTIIGVPDVPETMLMNGFANVIYSKDKFSAGLRYESYLNPLLGFDSRYKGAGIVYRYATYEYEGLEVTAGSFYEQFGNGMILRSYEERGLGFDNALDGIRLKYKPVSGLYLKGFIARQRSFFAYGPGIVRGFDAELALNEAFAKLSERNTNITVGGSVVSKFQKDEDPLYRLPENVAAFSGRTTITRGKVALNGEYAYKINDPQFVNDRIYRNGQALLVSASYSQRGMGLILSAKRVDNMNFRSDRNSFGNDLGLNYLPALTRQHTYTLATVYPYATQPNGEMAAQGEFTYKFKPSTTLGGKNGTALFINFSRVNSIDTINYNDPRGYKSDFFAVGDEIYYQELSVDVTKKLTDKLKLSVSAMDVIYNKGVVEKPGEPIVYANIGIIDLTWKIRPTRTLRTEIQHLYTEQDKGNWAMLLFEYSAAPHWFITVFDDYNYGNDVIEKQIHYATAGITYVKSANRFSLTYGRQKEGIFCVGGVCRNVPATNGFSFTVTSSF